MNEYTFETVDTDAAVSTDAAVDIILPVLEASILYASHYCKTCGRSTVTASDLEYGLKHAAMTYVGKKIGTHFPEDEEDEDEEDEDWASIVEDDDEEKFTRYEEIGRAHV